MALKQFIDDERLQFVCQQMFPRLYTHLQVHLVHVVLIINFIVTVGMAEHVSCYKQLESVHNLSDHLPIVHLNCDLEYAVPMSPVFIPKPKWDSATQTDIDNYQEQLDVRLLVRLLQEPPPECLVSCDDLQCKSHSHEI